jgi:hypothetical protein
MEVNALSRFFRSSCPCVGSKGRGSEPSLSAQVAARVEAKLKVGDAAAGLQKFQDALNAYDEALKELPERHSMAAKVHACKATVFVMEKKCAPPSAST